MDKELFKEAIELAQGNQNIFDWIPAGCTEWDQFSVELSIVNMAELSCRANSTLPSRLCRLNFFSETLRSSPFNKNVEFSNDKSIDKKWR